MIYHVLVSHKQCTIPSTDLYVHCRLEIVLRVNVTTPQDSSIKLSLLAWCPGSRTGFDVLDDGNDARLFDSMRGEEPFLPSFGN